MTVAELIEALQRVEDKAQLVSCVVVTPKDGIDSHDLQAVEGANLRFWRGSDEDEDES